jgi:hypothetical protein
MASLLRCIHERIHNGGLILQWENKPARFDDLALSSHTMIYDEVRTARPRGVLTDERG